MIPAVPGPQIPQHSAEDTVGDSPTPGWEQLERSIAELAEREAEIASLLESIRGILRSEFPGDRWHRLREEIIRRPAANGRVPLPGDTAVNVEEKPPGEGTSPLAGRTLAELERQAIAATLSRYDGNKAKTARALGISLRSIYNKMRRHGLTLSKHACPPHRPSEDYGTP